MFGYIARHVDDMAGFNPLDVLEETTRPVLRHQRDKFRNHLLVRRVGNFGERVQPFGDRGEGEKAARAMVMQRTLAEEIARQQQPLHARVPQREGEIADEAVERALAPAIEACEQDRGVTKLACLA
jgi:hypothetical protein